LLHPVNSAKLVLCMTIVPTNTSWIYTRQR